MFKYKYKKMLPLYIILGVLYALSMLYLSVPISSILPVPHTWNRNIFTVIAVICVIIISLFEKKILKKKYLWILSTAMLITFITTFFCGLIAFIFMPRITF